METREQTPARPARRVGTFTFGVTLVACGLWMLLSLLLPELDLLWALKLSPLALILLGTEVLLAARNNSSIRYDWVGMLLCCVIILTALSLFAAAWWVTRDPGGTFSAWSSGSRMVPDTAPELEYEVFRGRMTQLLEPEAGDVPAEAGNDAGAVSVSPVDGTDGEAVYASGSLLQAGLSAPIPTAGTRAPRDCGEGARGQASFTLAERTDA